MKKLIGLVFVLVAMGCDSGELDTVELEGKKPIPPIVLNPQDGRMPGGTAPSCKFDQCACVAGLSQGEAELIRWGCKNIYTCSQDPQCWNTPNDDRVKTVRWWNQNCTCKGGGGPSS